MPTRSTRTRMEDQRKELIDPKWPKQRKHPKELQALNLPIDNVENINSTNKKRDLILANKLRIVSWGTERMLQRIQRHNRVTLYRSARPKREQDQTEKSCHCLDWLQKGISYGPARLDNKLPQNVQHIRPKEVYFKEMHFYRLLSMIALMPLNHILRKCTAGYKLGRSLQINHLIYMDDIKLFAKKEKELETLIHAVRIYSQDIGMEFGMEKMCNASNEKWQTASDWRNGTTKSRQD